MASASTADTASADEVLRKQQKPRGIGPAEVATFAADLFGLSIDRSVKSLDSYDDLNFYVRAQANAGSPFFCRPHQEFVFKVHNGVESARPAFLQGMNDLLAFLSSGGLDVPTAMPGKDGARIQYIECNGVRHALRLLSWVPGKPLRECTITPALLEASGQYLGKLRERLDKFSSNAEACQPFKRAHSWDLRRSTEVRGFVHAVPTDERRALALSVFDEFEASVVPAGVCGDLRSGVLQADFNDANIIVDERTVTGVIDFGDAVWSWVINDIAVALAYVGVTAMSPRVQFCGFGPATDPCGHARAQAAMSSFIAGVARSGYSLNAAELKALPTLVACRLAMSGTMGCYTASQDPANAYITVHSEPAWSMLEALRSGAVTCPELPTISTSPAVTAAATTKTTNTLSLALLQEQDAATTAAVISALSTDPKFRRLSSETTAAIIQRDKEDDEKLAAGIQIGIDRGALPAAADLAVEEYLHIDVLGKSPEDVCAIITNHAGSALQTGAVVVMCGLSGTGKGTTVSLLRRQLPDAVTWSNGNVFRSVTLLAATWCEQQAKRKGADASGGGEDDTNTFDAEAALTPANIKNFMSMLEFGIFDGGEFDIGIRGLGLDVRVSQVANTLLKGKLVSKNIPTVAREIQGEVVSFAAAALEKMCAAGKTVLLEGRRQTVDYVRSPYRYILELSDPDIIGMRRCAQQLAASALDTISAGGGGDVRNVLLSELANAS